MTPTRTALLGRAAGEVAALVRQTMASGKIAHNGFLASERALAAEYSVDKKTVRRALKALESEGLLEAVERHGYRVLSGGAANRDGPLAYIPPPEADIAHLAIPTNLILAALRSAAARRSLSLLAVGSQRPVEAILSEVRRVGVSGIILDNDQAELVEAVQESGIAAVAVDAWSDDAAMDAVIQDGQDGGIRAVRHLLDKGCRRIAWLGPDEPNPHSTDRFSGVATALNDAGRSPAPDLTIRGSEATIQAPLRRSLSLRKRPDGICALWMGLAGVAAPLIAEAGLRLGRDVHMVGWCPEEAFDTAYRPHFGNGLVPPAVTWSVQTMAETAIARLIERRNNPGLPPVRVRVPMKLTVWRGE